MELSPLIVLPVALLINGGTVSIATLLEDGVLFFLSLVLSVGLFSDVLMDLQKPRPILHADSVAVLLMTLVIGLCTAWMGYYIALSQRVKKAGLSPYPSVILVVLMLLFTFGVRLHYGLW